jgi:transposase
MDIWLKRTVLSSTPESFGYDTQIWTCDILANLIEKQYDIKVTNSAINNHLHQLELTNQKPNYIPSEQDPDAVKQFVDKKFPKIQSFADKVGADIGFQDEAAVDLRDRSGQTSGEKGIRPNVYVTGQRGRVNILSAVTQKGDFYYRTTEERIASEQFIEFLEEIIENRDRRIFLIVDRVSFHRSKRVRTFIWHHRDLIRLFYLPAYSPELNPDEHAWEEIKDKQLGRQPIKNKRDLKNRLHAALESLKTKKERIISFFQLPETQYAA